MTLIQDKDLATAQQFFTDHPDIGPILQAYPEASDSEIMKSDVSLGCYLSYRLSGMDHQLASMQACRRGPRMKGSDQGFNEHARHRMNSMSQKIRDRLVKRAQASGIPTQGRFYVGPLADRRGPSDPRSWVSTTEDIRSVVRERNYEATGCVENRHVETPPAQKVPLAKDVVNELLQNRVKSDPDLQARLKRGGRKAIAAAREEIVHTHGRRR